MADKKKIIYNKGVVPRGNEFQSGLELKGEVIAFVRETLEKTTEEAFSDSGFPQADKPAGVYADGKAFGMGTATGHFNVKIAGKTQSFMEKQISFGGKRMFVEVHISIQTTSQTLELKYKTTEASAFRGYNSKVGPMMINEQLNFDLKNMDKFKKEFTTKMKEFAKKEAAYMGSTKLGTEDPIEKSTASMVENKGMSINDVFFSTDEEFLEKMNATATANIFEIVKDEKEEKSDEEKKEEDLLLSDKEEPKKNGEELNNEVTTAGAGAGSIGNIAYDAPLAKPAKRTFANSEYGKRARMNESKGFWGPSLAEGADGFWTVVSQETLDKYKKNHIMGAPGAEDIEINSESEAEFNSGGIQKFPGGKAFKEGDFEKHNAIQKEAIENQKKSIEEYLKIDPSVRKKWNREDSMGPVALSERWERLCTFEDGETIRRAESVTPEPEVISEAVITTDDASNDSTGARLLDINEGDVVDGQKVIKVYKKNTLFPVEHLVSEEDYKNEGKAYIHDYMTGNLVNNPNYRAL